MNFIKSLALIYKQNQSTLFKNIFFLISKDKLLFALKRKMSRRRARRRIVDESSSSESSDDESSEDDIVVTRRHRRTRPRSAAQSNASLANGPLMGPVATGAQVHHQSAPPQHQQQLPPNIMHNINHQNPYNPTGAQGPLGGVQGPLGGAQGPGGVAIMGGSMCADASRFPPPLQMSHPSAQSMHTMSATFQSPHNQFLQNIPPAALQSPMAQMGGVSAVPVTAQIAGPMRTEPVPFDDRTPMYGNITSSYGITNEMPRPMANIPIWQTPVTPFGKAADMSPYNLNQSPLQLFQNQGFDQDSWRPKREQGPMFTPQPENIYGMPAQAQIQRNRYEPSLELKHQKPFESEWSLRTGGFHPTTRILPTNVPVLRQQLVPNRVEGPTHATSHPSGLFGTSRGELGIVERRGFDTSCYYKVPFPTSAPVQAAPQYSGVEAKATSRQASSRPYGGVAALGASVGGAAPTYVKGQYLASIQKLPTEMYGPMGGPSTSVGATTAHFMDQARATLLEGTEMATMTGAVRAPVSAGTAQFMDEARPTLLQGTENAVHMGALNNVANAPTTHFMDEARATLLQGTENAVHMGALNNMTTAPTTHFMDQARTTLLELTEGAVREGALGGALAAQVGLIDEARATLRQGTELASESSVQGPSTTQGSAAMTYNMDPAPATLKQWTSDHAYEGGAGNVETSSAPMLRDNYTLNAILNEKLEAAMTIDRQPAMGPLGTTATNADRLGAGDPCTVRVRNDAHLASLEYEAGPNMNGQSQVRWIPQVSVSDQRALQADYRTESFALSQLATNPFALPLWNNECAPPSLRDPNLALPC